MEVKEAEASNVVSNESTTENEQTVNESNETLTEQTETKQQFPTPYLDRFNSEKVSFSADKVMTLNDLWVSNCNLMNVALAILAKVDWLRNSGNVRDKVLYNGYMSIKVSFQSEKEGTMEEHNVSVYSLAKRVLNLAESYSQCDFVESTMGTNWRWTIDKGVKETRGFDPFGLAKTELDVKLKEAKMTLLVKVFRMYLMETVRRVFPRTKSPQKWESSSAIYKAGGIERSSGDFVKYVDEMLKLYDSVVLLSPDLTEVKSIVNNAVSLGKDESAQKREQYQKKHNLEANYNQSLGLVDVSSGVGKRKEQKKTQVHKEHSESKSSETKPSVWNKEKTFVDKLVEKGELVRETPKVEPEKVEEPQKKRVVKSGGPKTGGQKGGKHVQFQEKQKQQPKNVEPTQEELEKQGYKTVKNTRKEKKTQEPKNVQKK